MKTTKSAKKIEAPRHGRPTFFSGGWGGVGDKGPHRYCELVRVLGVEKSQYVVYLTA